MSNPYKYGISHFVSCYNLRLCAKLIIKGGFCMNQMKIGAFLKELRKEKELTQEQLAERLNVSNRSVSRWETGSTLPDISMLVEIAEFYEVDIREIINGERKSENMNEEVKETILAVANYADKQKKQAVLRAIIMFALEMLCCGFTIVSIILIKSSDVKISLWFAAIPLAMTIAYSILLVLNAKSYVRKVQKER